MNKFNWSGLKNDPRLSPAQKKTVNKILVSLQIPVRDQFRNRPALTFNIFNSKFMKTNGQPNIPKINAEVRARLPKVYNNPISQVNTPSGFKTYVNPIASTQRQSNAALRQHRQAFGN